MPIYEYRCAACGVKRDILQRLSDPPATQCASCGKHALAKQVTAAGFQLKGSGWYATDFKNSGAKPAEKDSKSAESGSSDSALKSSDKPSDKSPTKPSTETSTSAAAASAGASPASE